MPITSSAIFKIFLAILLLVSCKQRSDSSVKDIDVLDELESFCKNYATQIAPSQRSFAKHILSVVGLAEPNATTNCSNFASKLKTHTEVRLGTSDRSIEDIGALKYFTNFQNVSIELRCPVFGIEEIGHRNLKELYLDWWNHNAPPKYLEMRAAYTGIGHLTNLRRLGLTNFKLENVDFLKPLTSLEILVLSGNQITDLSPLTNMSKLSDVILSYNKIRDLQPLAPLLELRTLELADNALENIDTIMNLGNLEVLDLSNNEQIKSILAVQFLPNLISLSAANTGLTNITPLVEISELRSLDLAANGISDLSPLANKEITWLGLSNNNIADIGPLASLSKLKGLDLENNPVKKFPNFKSDSPLDFVNLKNTQITDLCPALALRGITHSPSTTGTVTLPDGSIADKWNVTGLRQRFRCVP